MSNPATLKMLILAQAARIAELLRQIPEEDLKPGWAFTKEKAELKAKMAELRRDTVALEKLMYDWGAQ